tara:strand:- start:7368 stop:7853 length:486 start_codon:yes stop_codon:yes gene_type:complete
MASLFKLLRRAISGGPFYVRISRGRLRVRDISGGGNFDDEPIVVLSGDIPPKITAIGRNARNASAKWINPFSHPRIIIHEFMIAEKLLMHSFKEVSGKQFVRAAPVVIMHVTDNLEGGLTDIERRALQELALSAGARECHVWEGRELTDGELRAGAYKSAL